MLDFGRELFGNIVDVALYGMPPERGAALGLPDITLVMRVNDVQRSIALMELGLGMASQASGGDVEFEQSRSGADVTRYSIEHMPVFLAAGDNRIVISSSRDSMERALGEMGGQSVLGDLVFADGLRVLKDSPTVLIAACPGRAARMAAPFLSPEERAELTPVVDMLGETSITISAKHSNTKLGLGARVHNIPDISPLIAEALSEARGQRGELAHQKTRTAQPVEASVELPDDMFGDLKSMSRELETLARSGDSAGVARLGGVIAKQVDDAKALNNLAWAMLTEEPYAGTYDEVARVISTRANELSDYMSWYFLDTGALAEFRTGNLKHAIALQVKAVELAAEDGQHPELEESLAKYRAALAETRDAVVSAGIGS